MSTCAKRKHKTLTLQEKIEIQQKLDKGENMANLSREYGVGRATVHDIKTKKLKIQDHAKAMSNTNNLAKRKTMKTGSCPKMETALYDWFLEQRNLSVPISGEMLKIKAVELFKNKTEQNFNASNGWLTGFKRRFGVRLVQIPENKAQNDIPFIQVLQEKLDQLVLGSEQIYIAQEGWLFWKKFPKAFLNSQDRIGFMACANCRGNHKLNLMLVGTDQYSTDFRSISLPVFYLKQPETRITKDLLVRWFQEEFVPKVRKNLRACNLPEKALLLLCKTTNDIEAEQLELRDGLIETMTIPSTTPFELMDDNIISLIKSRYKNKFLINIFSHGDDLAQNIQEVNLKNAIFSLAQSWESIPGSTIQTAWSKFCPRMTVTDQEDHNDIGEIPVDTWVEVFAKNNWQISQEDLITWFIESDEETRKIQVDEVICKEEFHLTPYQQNVTNNEALLYLNKCITWAEHNGVSCEENMILRNLREKAFKQGLIDIKQNIITDYSEMY